MKQEYYNKLKQFEQDTKDFLKNGKPGRVGGIVKTKLLPSLERVEDWLSKDVDTSQQPKKVSKFEVVSTGEAKPVPEPKPEVEEEPTERKVLADSETPVKRKRTRKKKQAPKKDSNE